MQTAEPSVTVVGGFEIEAELGRGGMARVYRVRDPRSGRQLALKKLSASEADSAKLKAMFEREYHSLVQLAHPHIVSVFDYGVDADGPFYTMELLAGMDSRRAVKDAELGVEQACVLLRDIASALALIHSRRMLHRDVSPRNVWCTPEGRGKLIDFGTLVAMGPQTRLAGTPPFVPPEALYAQPMDARSDLYGLGAFAYFILTRRHAFPARELHDLRAMWKRRPASPRALRPEIPEALSDLVMALLSFDPRGRPVSAGEVVERVSAIAQLPANDERHLAQSYLTSPVLVGRQAESRLLRARISRAVSGRGSALAIVGPPGLGRSRILASVVLDAKLLGVTTVSIDAASSSSQPLALATAIAERLLEELPSAIDPGSAHARLLAQLSEPIRRLLGDPEPAAALPAHQRMQALSSAIVELVDAATRRACVLITVDDVQHADSASLAMLGRLSQATSGQRLLLLTSCEQGALQQAPPALVQLTAAPNRLELAPLLEADTRELLQSMFGAVPGLDEAASWLHELSRGSPQTCMQYAQYLVDAGIARYAAGQWLLPSRLREQSLPRSLAAMLEGRVAALGADAHDLALGLALARDETRAQWQPESHLGIESFPALLDGADTARTSRALDELLRAGIVEQRDSRYVLAQRAVLDALLRTAGAHARKAAHLRLGALFAREERQLHLAALQLSRAGDHARARALTTSFAEFLSKVTMNFGLMRVSIVAECARAVLVHWEAQGGTPREGLLLRGLLLMTSSVYDWSNARHGAAQLAQLTADCGLTYWEQTDPELTELQRVIACLQRAKEVFDRTPEAERGFAPVDAMRELATTALSLSAAFTHAFDIAGTRSIGGVLRPLVPLSPLLTLLADQCELGLLLVTGRDPEDRIETIAQRLLAATELPDVLRLGAVAINAHKQAIEDARRGRRRALAFIDLLVPGAGEDMFLVLHGRWLAHAFLGQSQLAERFRQRIEVITEDDVWRRKEYLFVEAQLHALTGNLLPLDRTASAIAELVPAFPGWRPWLAYARAESHRLRGELAAADAQLQAGLDQAPAGEHRAWVLLAPAAAELKLQRGDAHGAIADARAILQAAQPLALDRAVAVAAERVLALAESRCGEHAAASASLERAFVTARALDYGGLPLAQLHEAAARVALAAQDDARCAAELTQLRTLLEHADAPRLVTAYEALREASSTHRDIEALPQSGSSTDTGLTRLSRMVTDLRSHLASLNAGDARARHALDVLLEACGATHGHLFLFHAGTLFVAASTRDAGASAELSALAQNLVMADLEQTKTAALLSHTQLKRPDSRADSAPEHQAAIRHFPILLWDHAERGELLAGIAMLEPGDSPSTMPHSDIIRAISRCLVVAGDSVAVALES